MILADISMHFQLPRPKYKLVPSMAITRRDRNRNPTGGSRGRRGVDFGSLFQVGAKVEVSSNEDGFRGAWYGASILGPPRRSLGNSNGGGGSGVSVEYETLLSEANPSEFLREFIALPFVRPVPPEEVVKAESFRVLDVVDAFHRDGWWKGVVTEVVDLPKGERFYNVVFQDPCHQISFRASKLRFHLEWSNGSWTKPSKQKRIEGLTISKGMEVEVNLEKNSSKEAWCPATIVDEVGFCSFLVTCKSHVLSSPEKITVDYFRIRPLPPKVDIKSFGMLESVYAFCHSCWRPGYIIEVISREEFVVCLQNDMVEKEFSLLEIRPYLYWKDGKWVSYSRHAWRDSRAEVIKYLGTNLGNGTAEKHHPKLLKACSKSERKGVKRSSPGSGPEQLCTPRKSKRRNSNDSSFSPRCAELQLVDASIKSKDEHVPEGVTEGVANDIENQDPAIKEVDMQMIPYVEHSVPALCADDLINQNSAVEEVEPLLITYLQGGASDVDERNSAFQEGDLPMLPCAEPVDKECYEPELAAGEMNDEFDMVDIEMPTITSEKPAGESLRDGEKLCEQPSEEECSGLALAPADGIPSELVENAEISFFKTSFLWKTIESMEPFQLLPQKPHFRPLLNCPEENREAVAISSMVLFSELVVRTSKLQLDDPNDLFERYLGSLSELDSFGFNVKPVVECIEKLLLIKEMCGKLQDTSKQVQHKLADNKTEKSNLVDEIDVADKKIKELQEKRAPAAATLSAVEAKIATLQSDASALDENDAKAELEFRSIVASPW